jgi:hypothetical protein
MLFPGCPLRSLSRAPVSVLLDLEKAERGLTECVSKCFVNRDLGLFDDVDCIAAREFGWISCGIRVPRAQM